ncbi:hypothetical protein KKG41_03920 [Patescibacteria group bacterium]|nr:hypothetical protein [Patescibacteria group bacterium]MBU1890447.1 hypothetical protein [Patescibacteria group bacterium]
MKPKIHKNYYDVVILPPPKIRDYLISLSQQLYKYDSKWILGKRSYLPHLSLYHIPVKLKAFPVFIEELKTLLKNTQPGNLKLGDGALYLRYSSIILNTDKPTWLRKLYLNIIKNTQKYRDPDFDQNKAWTYERLPLGMKNNLNKYGTPMVGQYFIPHFTLSQYYTNYKIQEGFRGLKFNKYSFKPDYLYVCELALGHTCQKIIEKIPFE